MENSYGVGVLNRYALFLDDESDPLDALKQLQADKDKKKKTKDAEKENKGTTPLTQQHPHPPSNTHVKKTSDQSKPSSQQSVGGQGQRKPIKDMFNVKPEGPGTGGPRPEKRDNMKNNRGPPGQGQDRDRDRDRERNNRPPRNREDRVDGQDGEQRPPRREFGERKNFGERRNFAEGDRDRERPERRHYNNDERPDGDRAKHPRERFDRGGKGPRGPAGGKREFDRRSGSDRTGVKPVDKRDGGGSHNWGSHKDDIEDFNKTQSEGEQTDGEKADPSSPGAPPAPAPQSGGEEEPAAPVEEEPKELTLDEWKALQKNRQKPQYNLRKAGEGEDLSQWKNMVVLKKTKADGEESDDEYDSAEYPQRVGRQKKVMGIEFAFYESRRGGGGPRGRGGRGRGGPGGGGRPRREQQPQQQAEGQESGDRFTRWQNAPKVDDSKDFPSLG